MSRTIVVSAGNSGLNGYGPHRTLTSGVQIDTSVIQHGTGAADQAIAKGAD